MSGSLPIVLVVAIARNRAIGVAGGLPWRLKSDLRRFRTLTMGKPIVMGRKTFESIGKPLDGRANIVISRRRDFAPAGVTVVRSLEEALRAAATLAGESGASEICIIGGGEVFAETVPIAERLLVTHVDAEPAGDVFFPEIGPEWTEVSREALPRSEHDTADAVFSTYTRRGTA
jgi:dihydrofolate reductase